MTQKNQEILLNESILGNNSKKGILLVCCLNCGAVVITATQLDSTKPELRFCTGSNLARSVLERISDNGPSWK